MEKVITVAQVIVPILVAVLLGVLDYCYANRLMPFSMCEVFYGNDSETKKSGQVYGPCDERCGLILPEILGLEVLYRDSHYSWWRSTNFDVKQAKVED